MSTTPQLSVIVHKFEGTHEEYAAAQGPEGAEFFKFADYEPRKPLILPDWDLRFMAPHDKYR